MDATHRLTIPANISVVCSPGSNPVHAIMLDRNGEIIDSILHHGTVSQARRKLQDKLFDDLRLLADDRANWRRHVIATVEGSIFLIEWRHRNWGYSITGPGRSGPSSCWGSDSFEEACGDARRHAASGFNGVAWETYF